MSLLQKSSGKTSSRRQINLKGVQDGLLMLPGNEYRAVLQASSVNFELKSEEEQDALIETYQSFLNSLDCDLQVIVRIRELDMDNYLAALQERLAGEKEAIYRTQLENYSEFVQGLIRNNKILTRHFYVIVPYTAKDSKDFEVVKEQLSINCDIVSKGLTRMGMQSRILSSLEVLDLFYSFYNPGQAKRQPITTQAMHLLHTNYIRKGVDHEDNNTSDGVEKAKRRPTKRSSDDARGAGSSGRAVVRRDGGTAGLLTYRRPVRADAFYLRLPVRGVQRVARQLDSFQSRRGH